VTDKWKLWLPIALMLAFAFTRWPGLMPLNFSAAYALAFCAGVYFGKRTAWLLPLGTLLVTDLLLNLHYGEPFRFYQLFTYVAYVALITIGRFLGPNASLLKLLGGSLLGAIVFYLVTNTAAWFFNPFKNPEYTKDLFGWVIALTKGTANWPDTWMFFRNTLTSSGLFTGLFVGAMKLAEVVEEQEEESPEVEPEPSKTPA